MMTNDRSSPESSLGRAIGALSDAAFCPALGSWLVHFCAFDSLTVLAFAADAAPIPLHAGSNSAHVHARLHSHYVAGAYLLDPFHALHRDRAPDGLYALRDVAPDHFHRHEYFATYYRATTLTDEIVFSVRGRDAVSFQVCLGREGRAGRRFPGREIAAARRIAPVVSGLVARQWHDFTPARTRAPGAGPRDLAHVLRERLGALRGIALSRRQAETATMILRGHSTLSIALTLGVSAQTVKVFRRQLYDRCAISSQAELFSLILPLLAPDENPHL